MSTLVSNTIKPRRGDTVTFADCNISVGGTSTYEDVTNIDSIGIITARSDIEVSGIVTAMTGTAVTYHGDGSKLTGFEFGVENFVASGTIDNGKTVVLNTDGTVGIVTQTTSSTPTVGDPVVFESGITADVSVAYIGSSKVVIAYCDDGNNGHGTAVVGTVDPSNNLISFGDPAVFEYANVGGSGTNVVYDSTNDRVVVSYRDGGNNSYGTSMVGQVIGTGITFDGASTVFVSDTFEKGSATFDSTNGKVVVVWRSGNNPNVGNAVVGTVNAGNNSIGFATVYEFNSYYTGPTSTTYDSTNQRVVIVHQDAADGGSGKVVVVEVVGTGITFGTPVEFESSTIEDPSATFDSTNGKVVFVYRNDGNNWCGTARVGTVDPSDNSISFGPEVVYDYSSSYSNSVVYDSVNERVVIAYQDHTLGDLDGTAVVGEVVGTAITFTGDEFIFEADTTSHIGSGYDSVNERVVIAYRDENESNKGKSVVFSVMPKTTNLTTENYIGIAGEAIANATTGKVNVIGGVNSGQSGLTTAQTYYVGQTGILTTTADTPSVVAGTSMSSTEILIR